MSGECDKCGEHCLDCKCKTNITASDLQKYVNEAFTDVTKEHI